MNILTIIDKQYESGVSLLEYLQSQQQLPFIIEAENNFGKTILLSAASFFEKKITDTVIEMAVSFTDNNELVVSMIKQKVVARQYHTYFDWDKTNANKFFSLFGEEFKDKMIKRVKDDPKLDNSIRSFLEIGRERNKMVHENFAEIVTYKTANEIYKLYQDSLYFIEIIKSELIKVQSE